MITGAIQAGETLVPGQIIMDQEGERAMFLRSSSTTSWGFFRYADGYEAKMPISGPPLILKEAA